MNLVPDLEIHLRLLGWHLDLDGRPVWLLAVSVTILALAAVPVFLSGKPEQFAAGPRGR